MSIAWYTWLEQARTVSVSYAALERLAEALELSSAERRYLHELTDPEIRTCSVAPESITSLQRVVDEFNGPAYILDRTWHIQAANRHAQELFSGWNVPALPVNLLTYIFLDERARVLITDWDERATRILAEFRADTSRYVDDPNLQAVIDDLQLRSQHFAEAWTRQSVMQREGGARTFHHAERGHLRFEQATFLLATSHEMKLVVLYDAMPLGTTDAIRIA